MKKSLCLLLAMVLLCAAVPAWAGQAQSTEYFDTPQAAAAALVERVAQGALDSALNTMADLAVAQAYDYAALVSRVQQISPAVAMASPSDYAAYVPLNALRKRSQNSFQLHMLITSLVLPEIGDLLYPLQVSEEGVQVNGDTVLPLAEYVARYNPDNLQDLQLHSLLQLDSQLLHSENNQMVLSKTGAINGYLEQLELLAILTNKGQLWQMGLSAARFEAGWQLTSLNAPLIGTEASGGATPTDEAAVQALLDSGDYLQVYPVQ